MASVPPTKPPNTGYYTRLKSMSIKSHTNNTSTGNGSGSGKSVRNDNYAYSIDYNNIDNYSNNGNEDACSTANNNNNNNDSNINTLTKKKKNTCNLEGSIHTTDRNKNEHIRTGGGGGSGSGKGSDVDRVVATAQQILRTLSSSQADDMVRILSDFDDRLAFGLHHSDSSSSDAPSHHHRRHRPHHRKSTSFDLTRDLTAPYPFPAITKTVDHFPPSLRSAEKIIMQWDINASTGGSAMHSLFSSSSTPLLWSDERSEEIPAYLHAIDTLHELIQTLTKASSSSSSSSRCSSPSNDYQSDLSSSFDHLVSKGPNNDDDAITNSVLNRAQSLMQTAMARLEVEFTHLLETYSEASSRNGAATSGLLGSAGRGSGSGKMVMEEAGIFVPPNLSQGKVKEYDDAGDEDPAGTAIVAKEHADADGDGGGEDKILPDHSAHASDGGEDKILPEDDIQGLQAIATRMLRAGYAPDLTHILVAIRRSHLHGSLHRAFYQGSSSAAAAIATPSREEQQQQQQQQPRSLALTSFEAVQKMAWEALEEEIRAWARAMQALVSELLPRERWLCEKLLAGHSPQLASTCTMDIAKGSVAELLRMADAVSVGRRVPERLAGVMAMHECLQELIPGIEAIFGQNQLHHHHHHHHHHHQHHHHQQHQQKEPEKGGYITGELGIAIANASLCLEAAETLGRLADAARGIFSSFERFVSLHEEGSRAAISRGDLLPLVPYVMRYLGSLLPRFAPALNQLLLCATAGIDDAPPADHPITTSSSLHSRSSITISAAGFHSPSSCNDDEPPCPITTTTTTISSLRARSSCRGDDPPCARPMSPLSLAVSRVMRSLEKKIDSRSQLYRDPALACLFLMNNLHFVGRSVKRCDALRKLLGEEWMKRNNAMLKQHHATYRRTWASVLSPLKDEGLRMSRGPASSSIDNSTRNLIKDKFKAFSAAFEENVRTQSAWAVSDDQLCSELIVSVTEMILPAYRSFYGRFHNYLDVVKHKERYVKYTPDDLEAHLNSLFGSAS